MSVYLKTIARIAPMTLVLKNSPTYSSVPNRRAGPNKRAGGKILEKE